MNKRGFTLVELLTTVVVLGILMGGAIMGVIKYLDQSRNTAYKAMESSAYDAMQNYVMERTDSIQKDDFVTIETLVNEGYLEELSDPVDKGKTCTGRVTIIENNSATDNKLNDLKYRVKIKCKKYESKDDVIYPKE